MEFTLVKKVVIKKEVVEGVEVEKQFTNFYLKNGELILPICIKQVIINKECVNKEDFKLACKLAVDLKSE